MTSPRADAVTRPVDFEDPPVVETALGILFVPLKGWTVLHYGLLWNLLRTYYSRAEVRAPSGTIDFSAMSAIDINAGDEIDLGAFPLRCKYIDSSETQLLQVQSNAFIRNWRKTARTPEYQHYDAIRPSLFSDWERFTGFLKEEGLPQPDVWQCEVTYINHLVRGKEWNSLEDIREMFPSLSSPITVADPNRSPQQMMSFVLSYQLPDSAGQLQIQGHPGLRKTDGKEIVQLSLTASGKPKDSTPASVFDWLDFGHLAVVNNFKRFTSVRLHDLWRMK